MHVSKPKSSDTARHPYSGRPDRSFWRRSVQNLHPMDIAELYVKKFSLTNSKIASAGSCFAQHIGSALKSKGFSYVDIEPAPNFLPPELHKDYGYSLYSARYGNVYTSRQLLQLVQRALGEFVPRDEAWEKDGGFVDPFRPNIEPQPSPDRDEIATLRAHHLKSVVRVLEEADVLMFTFGLTETWSAAADGAVFPMAPGTAGGRFDPSEHKFVNLSYVDVFEDMEATIARLRNINSDIKILVTVSPVPLIATATNNHVVTATTYSKSVLRAVAGALADKYDFLDYFPSYEIISSHPMRAMFFDPDMRTVAKHGVEHVMKQFFEQHTPPVPKAIRTRPRAEEPDRERIVCDEEIAEAFGGRSR